MNNAKELFDREGTEESIVEMDTMSGGSEAGDSAGSPGTRFKVDTTTASGEPIEVGSPILSSHSAAMSSPAPPPPYSPERRSETPTRGQIILKSATPPSSSSHSRPSHLPTDEYGNESERHALRGNIYEDEEDDDEASKPMAPRPPIITGIPSIELPDGKMIRKDAYIKLYIL